MTKAPIGAFCIRTGLAVLTILLITCPSVRAGQDKQVSTVYAVGSSSIRGADMSAGRKEAISDSLVVAVTQVLNDMMPPETVEGNFQVLSESILSRPDQFIIDYKMLTEATHASTHRVMVKVTVSAKRLKDALKQSGIYIGQKKFPQILYCIAEKQVGDVGYQYWWSGQSYWRSGVAAETISKISKDKGFVIVTPTVGQSTTAYPPELSVPEAVALGQQLQG
jgi:hypothetical protein